MKTILGIDGGGTNTRGLVRRGAQTLAHAQCGSIKRLRVGPEQAAANLRSLLRDLYSQADIHRLDAASAGIASASLPGVAEWIEDIFREFHVERFEIVGDEVIALDAAFHGGPGIFQIAGTGSNCIGRTATGQQESAGGYSSTLGDEGSGYWIGLHAIRRALRAFDREQPTRILDEVSALWQTPTLSDLVQFGNSTPAPDFAALAPVVARLAEDGDAVAQGVLDQAADDLADFVLAVREKLRRHPHRQIEIPVAEISVSEIPVAWTGSVLEKIPRVLDRFTRLLQFAAPGIEVATTATVPLEGALWRAERLASQ